MLRRILTPAAFRVRERVCTCVSVSQTRETRSYLFFHITRLWSGTPPGTSFAHGSENTTLAPCRTIVIIRQTMYVWSNIEARSRNQRYRGKGIFWVCVCSLSYPACKAYAPYYIVNCGLSGSTIFFHILRTERDITINIGYLGLQVK
jgi:hypothetical protein